MAAVRPDALDKLNTDEIIDEYSNMLGIAPHLIVANEDVAIIRQDRAAAQAKAEQMAAIPEMANTAKTLSETQVGEGTALDNVASQFTQQPILEKFLKAKNTTSKYIIKGKH